jgi:hypothetical protein
MANVKKPHETITQQRRQQQPAAGKWVGKTTRSWKAIDLQRLYMTPEYTSTETAALLLNNKLRDGQVDNKSIMHRSTTDTTSPESDKETIVKSVIPLTAEKPAVSTIAHQNKSAQKCIPKKAQAVKIKKDTAKPRNGPTLPVNMEGKELPKGVTFRPSKKWVSAWYRAVIVPWFLFEQQVQFILNSFLLLSQQFNRMYLFLSKHRFTFMAHLGILESLRRRKRQCLRTMPPGPILLLLKK